MVDAFTAQGIKITSHLSIDYIEGDFLALQSLESAYPKLAYVIN
jgi:hypothetical protein